MKTRNLTLSLSDDLIRQVKVIAAQRDTSISRLVEDALRHLVEDEIGYEEARRRMMAALAHPLDLGTHGKITWTRDSLHER